MATMITSDCINCGACEPECPNNAISQGEDIYVIDPLLCTECVGFHDYEACAAVCPVDCCVTDPNNIENEDILIARAKDLHRDVQFSEDFESRFRKKEAEKPERAEPLSPPKPSDSKAASSPAPSVSEQKAKTVSPQAAAPAPPSRQPPSKPQTQVPKVVSPPKHFPGEVSTSFQEALLQFERQGPLTRTLPRILIFLSQPLLGALPHQEKKELEKAVQTATYFSAAGATGLNVLFNMILYPLISMMAAAGVFGFNLLFSQGINTYILVGFFLGFLEGVYRLRDGVFHARPVNEMTFPPALYGIPLSYAVRSFLLRRTGLIRSTPVPVDGFYEKGFIEKLERERRYGNVYTLEDWGDAYFLRVEFPRKVPDIGLPIKAEMPEEMPDYDYDLLLRDGHFIVRGKCVDEKVRKITSSVGAFPPEFITVIPLKDKVEGFSHRFENKLLEVLLLKVSKRKGGESGHLQE